MINQISVLIQNKGKALIKAIDILADAKVDIRALSVADTNEYGILRIIVNDTYRAVDALKNSGHILQKTPVVAVIINDKPGSFSGVLDILSKNNIIPHYFYSFIKTRGDCAYIAIRLDDINEAESLLKEKGVRIATDADIKNFD